MKKILVITPFFYPHIGGSEKYMERLYVFIKKNNPNARVDVLTYNTNNAPQKEVYRGLNIYRIPCLTILPDQFCLPDPVSLFKFLSNHKDYDLIHCSTRFFDSSWWGVVFAKLMGKRAVLTDHCAYHPVHKNPLVSLAAKLIDLSIVAVFINFFDEVYTESKTAQKFFKETFNINPKLAYPGVEIYKQKKQHKGRVKVVFIGRLIESKGVKTLFNLAGRIQSADFVFAGPGKVSPEFRKIKNVKILGSLSERETQKLLSQSDIFAYPSFHSEGIPMALLEAGGNGICVIAIDTGGIKEVIENNKTGILVKKREDFESSLIKLIDNRELRDRLGKNLQKYIEKNFSWMRAANLITRQL